jgi:hypothetical protein
MKKIGYTLLLLLFIAFALAIGLFVYEERNFNPLKSGYLRMLFPDTTAVMTLKYHKDLLGIGSDFFDFYIYETENTRIDPDYPYFKDKWEFVMIDSTVVMSKWKECPIDSVALSVYEHLILQVIDRTHKLPREALGKKNNYYCYLYSAFSDFYFLLYDSQENLLYYISKKE